MMLLVRCCMVNVQACTGFMGGCVGLCWVEGLDKGGEELDDVELRVCDNSNAGMLGS
jgi:hypothetical protein